MVQLSPEVPIKAVTHFLDENKINLIHLGLKAWKADTTWKPVTEELIKEALEIVLNVESHPVMVTCTSGVHQTGVLVGCLRRLQNWNLTSILVEYRMFTQQSNTRYVNEQFIELFDVDLVTLPPSLPDWFVAQRNMLAEEEEECKKPNLDAIHHTKLTNEWIQKLKQEEKAEIEMETVET